MKFASVTERLADLGGAKWTVYSRARELLAEGRDVIELTIGEPDVPTPPELIDAADQAMRAGRTKYSNGSGEKNLIAALAARYSRTTGRTISKDQFLCFPGTQTALYAVATGLLETGDEILIGDPLYATYEGVIASTGATVVPVPLRPEHRFHLQADDLAARITKRTRAILVNSPHNPTGAVLTRDEVQAIGTLAKAYDLWIIADEVYEELIFDGVTFSSPLSAPDLADRTVVVSSISKSHAAPGFRSGWCVGSAEFCAALLPLSETMLFGNQPFIADMTELAVSAPSQVAADMAQRLARRAGYIHQRLDGQNGLAVHRPEAGMFALVDVRAFGLSSEAFAMKMLEEAGVAVMPGTSFGPGLEGWLRLALTVEDDALAKACDRILAFTTGLAV